MKKILLYFFTCFAIWNAGAQDFRFLQLQSSPLQINPAHAGNALVRWDKSRSRFCLGHFQDNTIHENVSYATYDRRIKKPGAGLGGILQYQRVGNGLLTIASVKGIYNQHLWLKKNTRLSIALQTGLENKTVDRSRILLLEGRRAFEQINPAYYDSVPFRGEASFQQKTFFSLGAGLLLSSKRYQAGASIQNINRPNWAMSEGVRQYKPFLLTVHGTYRLLNLNKDKFACSQLQLDMQAVGLFQDRFVYALTGFALKKGKMRVALSHIFKREYRFTGHSLLANIGAGTDNFNIYYGLEMQPASSGRAFTVSHSISLVLTPLVIEKPVIFKPIICPDF